MKMKTILSTAAITLTSICATATEVRTYQGSTRWATTLFTPDVRTASATTSYTTYYLIEQDVDTIIDAVKIDAFTNQFGRFYYVDTGFNIEYGFFGVGGGDVAGGMEVTGLSAVLPFRGTIRYGDLNAFTLYTSADYYRDGSNIDITKITGSARFNTNFSGNVSLDTAVDAVLDYLESRGYTEAD